MEKREIEEMLNSSVSDKLFSEASGYARRKQQYIYDRDKNPVVLQEWYLKQLTAEQVISLSFSQFTMDLCRTMRDMEKEHSALSKSAPRITIL